MASQKVVQGSEGNNMAALVKHHLLSPHCDPPDPKVQRGIVDELEPDESDDNSYCYRYAVCRHWYKSWKKHVGLAEGKYPGQTKCPDAVTMNNFHEDGNKYISGHLWKVLINWYGLDEAHELDRRFRDPEISDEQAVPKLKTFEVCILGPLVGRLKHRTKLLDLSEFVGYIELQLRRIFRVARHMKTRLWICEKGTGSVFEPIFDRTEELHHASGIEDDKTYVIALEMTEVSTAWSSGLPDEPVGNFDAFVEVTEGSKPVEFWDDLFEDVHHSNASNSEHTKEKLRKYLNVVKAVGDVREKELGHLQNKCQTFLKWNESFENELNRRKIELDQLETDLSVREFALQEDRRELKWEKEKFCQELHHVEEMNKIQEEVVKLNIGGEIYTTCLSTLRKEPDSMFAVMFSGRYPLRTDENGCFFVDRDGTHFHHILNYLRNGHIQNEQLDAEVTRRLLDEADFYVLDGLCKALRIRLGEEATQDHCLEETSDLFGNLFAEDNAAGPLTVTTWCGLQ